MLSTAQTRSSTATPTALNAVAVTSRRHEAPTLDELNGRIHALTAQKDPTLKRRTLGRFSGGGKSYDLPCVVFAGPDAGHDPIRLALFAGIHGDEPAGCVALIELLASLRRDPQRAAGYELWVYPLVNPSGYENGTRCNAGGKDLNREFWCNSTEAEVRLIEAELRAQPFAGIVTLHADDTCEGVYGYAHGRMLNEALLTPALKAAAEFLPVDERGVIDGFPARAGLICDCFAGVLSAPPEQRPQPFDLIIETPAAATVERQVQASCAALHAILATYPGFISYAQDL